MVYPHLIRTAAYKVLEWSESIITENSLQLVARLSSRVFLGEDLCRNEAWLQLSKDYTVNAFKTSLQMSLIPSTLRRLAPWFSKDAKVVLQLYNNARAILAPVVKKRNQIKIEARQGKSAPVFDDMLEWLEEESHGDSYDPVTYQMFFAFAAIHTTSDLLAQSMIRFANEPGLINELRKEIIRTVGSEGLTKSGLSNLKLMDSALKETQRVKPSSYRKCPV